MSKLFDGKILVYNAQVSLMDTQAKDYPQWETGKEKFVYIDKGIAVSTDTDTEVRVIVSTDIPPNMYLLGVVEINIDMEGIQVGNEISGDVHHIQWNSGKTSVEIYVDNEETLPEIVGFVLKKINSSIK